MSNARRVFFIGILASLFFLPASGQAAPLKLGMTGDEVSWLQSKLVDLGFYAGSVDNVFGQDTKRAVISFQSACGLDADGIVGEQTKQMLREYKNRGAASRGAFPSRRAAELVSYAQQFYGTPYAWGGTSPGGFDCSGFIYHVFSRFNIAMPRVADAQYYSGISVSDPQPGDLVFFSTYEPGPSHVGIFIGNGQFIHASSGAGEVTITPLSKPYYQSRYLGAKRFL
ncbi:NlpC/P60 family protein [Azotosporobacter soli]|uniref:C40 family peptidase n=1 Tax=Azotosporobacter soli TaxID=3055040 RepID=UPI0031FE97FE